MATRSLEVTRALREGVLHGRYAGGTRMNEIDLAEALGVSRTPVRGALSTLAAEGLLDYTPNSGYVVRRFTARDIADIYAVRAELDGLAARLAAEIGLDECARQALLQAVADGEALVAAGQWHDGLRTSWADLNHRFHSVIYAACRNGFLVSLLRRATDVPVVSHARVQSFDIEAIQHAHDDHVELADAILAGDGKRAAALGTEHVYRAGRRIIAQWQRVEARPPRADLTALAAGGPR